MKIPLSIKHCIPSFQERFNAVFDNAARYFLTDNGKLLDLGCGEGEYAFFFSQKFKVTALDVNPEDIDHCRDSMERFNYTNIEFICKDAIDTGLPTAGMDHVISVDVLEHVAAPQKLITEISRVLRPGGRAIITFPSSQFPWTYDPWNALADRFHLPHIPFGAYGYGHTTLLTPKHIEQILLDASFSIIHRQGMTSYLAGLCELYWASILQRLFKRNAANQAHPSPLRKKTIYNTHRSSLLTPVIYLIYWLILFLNRIDRIVFGHSARSVGVLYVVEKGR